MRHQPGDKQGTAGHRRCLEDVPWHGDTKTDSQSCRRATARELMSGSDGAGGGGFRITEPSQRPASPLVIARCQQTAELPGGAGTCGEVVHLQAGSSCTFPLTARQTQPGQRGYAGIRGFYPCAPQLGPGLLVPVRVRRWRGGEVASSGWQRHGKEP